MEHDDMAGHFVGILLVLAMLSCAAAFETPAAASGAEPSAFEDNAAAGTPDAAGGEPLPSIPYVALSP